MKIKTSNTWIFILVAIIFLMIMISVWKKNEKFMTPELAKYYNK